MEAAIITLLATLIVIIFGGFWRVRTDIADFKADIKADIARIDTKLDTHTERLDKVEAKTDIHTERLADHDTQIAVLADRTRNSPNDTKPASTAKSESLAEAPA